MQLESAPGTDHAPLAAVSIVVLTYNRLESLRQLLAQLTRLDQPDLEVIVVDNCSDVPASTLAKEFPEVDFLRTDANTGTGGRNVGIARARHQIVVCLDDDVGAPTDSDLEALGRLFADPLVGGVCFKVIDAGTGETTNWVHHKPVEHFADVAFETYEITEGAVALRRDAAVAAGLYPERFFISHEGPDLAFRMIERGYRILYEPSIRVTHAYAPQGRASWRNYYFDTRNTFWLVARTCPPVFGLRILVRQVGSMLVYSLRDGFFGWWLRGVLDGLRGTPQSLRERTPMSPATMRRIVAMDADRPGVVYLLRRRLLQRGIRI